MKQIITLIVATLIISCSPQKRLNRLYSKHPELFVKDSILVRDTITIKSHSVDTTFVNVFSTDTLVIEDSVMVIKYVNDGKTVYLKGECKERLIPYETKVFVDKPIITKTVKPWYDKYVRWWFWLTIAVIVGFILRSFVSARIH
jgi:hypothetical protein